MRSLFVMIVLGLLTVGPGTPDAIAQDHDRARDAVQAGQVRPLGDILASIRGRFPGRLLDTKLKQRGRGKWLYDIKILQNDGRVVALTVDASSGRVLSAKGQRSNRGNGKRKRRNNRQQN